MIRRGSLVRQAAKAFSDGNFGNALRLYEELSRLIGQASFAANIKITKKRLALSGNRSTHSINSRGNYLLPTLPVLPFEMPAPRARKKLTIASILDNFSDACFRPECNLIPITPSGWGEELIDRQIDFVLVESAWHGNDDAWQYRVANYSAPPGNELFDLLSWARRAGVPTVFWNKEDPPNFDRFIGKAVEFDYIFTTDENCVQRYKDRVPKSTFVGSLPFAAQPRIHNPYLDQPRVSATSFAGTYYADDYESRRRSMDMLLRVATRHGLDIFDRMYGVNGKDKSRFEFPQDLQQFIRGTLTYDQMLKAYRRYRVGLNVNSVSDSPTMFSRRVFELLACGTPVVSTASQGIDRIFAGLVPTVESEEEAAHVLDALMLDHVKWLEASIRGLRAIHRGHTYAHRLHTIAKAVGLDVPDGAMTPPLVLVFPRGDAVRFAEAMHGQELAAEELVVVGEKYTDVQAQSHVGAMKAAGLNVRALPAENIMTFIQHRFPEHLVAICDSRHNYGRNYLLDAVIALQGAPEGGGSTILPDSDPVLGPAVDGFESAARLGMSCSRVHTGTTIVKGNTPLLMSVLKSSSDEDILPAHLPDLRTRAGFGFMPRGGGTGGRVGVNVDLR